jgi:hypothetical protein
MDAFTDKIKGLFRKDSSKEGGSEDPRFKGTGRRLGGAAAPHVSPHPTLQPPACPLCPANCYVYVYGTTCQPGKVGPRSSQAAGAAGPAPARPAGAGGLTTSTPAPPAGSPARPPPLAAPQPPLSPSSPQQPPSARPGPPVAVSNTPTAKEAALLAADAAPRRASPATPSSSRPAAPPHVLSTPTARELQAGGGPRAAALSPERGESDEGCGPSGTDLELQRCLALVVASAASPSGAGTDGVAGGAGASDTLRALLRVVGNVLAAPHEAKFRWGALEAEGVAGAVWHPRVRL